VTYGTTTVTNHSCHIYEICYVERLQDDVGGWWEDNIRMDLRQISWEIVDWMHLAQNTDQWGAVVNTVMKFGFHIRWEIS